MPRNAWRTLPAVASEPRLEDTDAAATDDLAWLVPVLWPGVDDVTIGVRRPRDGDMIALPTRRRARLLLPASHLPTAELLLQHTGAGHSSAWRGLRRGAGAVLRRVGTRTFPMLSIGGASPTPLLSSARRVFPSARALGVRLGSWRPNRKPVLLVADGDGHLVGVGKVGWNDLTRRLVRREASALPDAHDGVVLTPANHGTTDHGAVTVLWQGPLDLDRSSAVDEELLAAGMREIQALRGEPTPGRLGTSDYAARLQARAADTPWADLVDTVMSRHADRELLFGTMHGDFTPWNVAAIDGQLAVWDWERSADDMPVGIDVLHWYLRLTALAAGTEAEHRRARDVALPVLQSIGVEEAAVDAISALHLLELLLRFDAANHRAFDDGILRVLRGDV